MKDLIGSVINILRYIGAFFTFIRNSLLNLFLVMIIIFIILALLPREDFQVRPGTLLRLDISGDIVEEKKLVGSFEKLIGEYLSIEAEEPETALQDILDVINEAAADDRITGLTLNLSNMGRAGINQLQSIGEALQKFKESGKLVIAADDYYTQSRYFLASFASKVILHPMGAVDIHGFGVYRLYFKDGVDKLKITYNVFKVGTYKSALEPFTRNSMSDEDRRQNEQWLTSLWQLYNDVITKQRNITSESLYRYTHNIIEELRATKGDTARLALEAGLVDQIATRGEIRSYLSSLAPGGSGEPKIISSSRYQKTITPSYTGNPSSPSKIGLIIAEGNILPGKQPPGMIGGDSLAELIRRARKNSSIKGLVLRINSGGGSAFASEIIRQELLELKKSRKPLVVSMGTVAASGGYWIAADADEIWASPGTITGSIGIFGAIPTFEKSLASLGIYRDGLGTTPLASGLDLTQPLPESLKNVIQQSVSHNYDQFLQIVADGREMEKTEVAALAEGRIYDGRSAKSIGLVDRLGSLEEAIQAAADLAELQDFTTEYIRLPVTAREQFLQFLTSAFTEDADLHQQNRLVAQLKRTLSEILLELPLAEDPQGIYAQCLQKLRW